VAPQCGWHQWKSPVFDYNQFLVQNELNDINPRLIDKYSRVSALVNYWNWKIVQPDMPIALGVNLLNIEEKEVEAKAINFPVLIHELSKGVMDYLISRGLPTKVGSEDISQDDLRYIYREADKYANEQWHYFFDKVYYVPKVTKFCHCINKEFLLAWDRYEKNNL